jgi:hypothetical protein
VRYFEKESGRRFRRELLTRDEAQCIAAIFAGMLNRIGDRGLARRAASDVTPPLRSLPA